jgi:hypothetical protein
VRVLITGPRGFDRTVVAEDPAVITLRIRETSADLYKRPQ